MSATFDPTASLTRPITAISGSTHSSILLCSEMARNFAGSQKRTLPPALIDSTGLQVDGASQWLVAKYGAKPGRSWRKLHLAVDAASGMIVAQTLTDQDVDDPSQVGSVLDLIDDPIVQVTADGASDGAPHLSDDRAAQRWH